MTKLNEAAVAFRRGDLDRARTRLDDAEVVFRGAGLDPATDDRAELDRLREQLACAAR